MPTVAPILAAVLALGASAAAAATVDVQVRNAAGQPVADAVVMIDVASTPPPRPSGSYAMRQQNISFQPHVLIVPVGATVAFPNMDRVRHHVYSFSKTKRFELKLYGHDETRSVTFDTPGVVALGCNIHDSMSGFIIVSATPFAAKTDASGHALLTGVPAGAATLRIWQAQLRAPSNMLGIALSVPANGLAKAVTIPQ